MILKRMVLRFPEDTGQAGTGQGSSQGSGDGKDAQGAGGTPPKKDDSGKPPPSSAQFVTPEILQGVLGSHARTQEEKFASQTKKLSGQIENITKVLDELSGKISTGSSGKGSGGSEGGKIDPPELIELRKKNRELEDSLTKIRTDLNAAQQREKDFRFQTQVMEALQRNKCLKPSVVFAAIRPELTMSEDGKILKAGHSDQFGTRDLDLDTFIKEVVSESLVPELFLGKTRAGSPAGGDQAGGEGKWDFTLEQIRDPEFYRTNHAKIEEALKRGRVRLTPASSSK